MDKDEKAQLSIALRNNLIDVINSYNRVFGNMEDISDAMAGARQTYIKKINQAVDNIKDTYSNYTNSDTPVDNYTQDYPSLAPIVTELAKLDTDKNSNFNINDLRDVISRIPRAQPPEKKPDTGTPKNNDLNPFRMP